MDLRDAMEQSPEAEEKINNLTNWCRENVGVIPDVVEKDGVNKVVCKGEGVEVKLTTDLEDIEIDTKGSDRFSTTTFMSSHPRGRTEISGASTTEKPNQEVTEVGFNPEHDERLEVKTESADEEIVYRVRDWGKL